MAEKYGTIPKKFTKEWWSWYWMYYKGITIGVIFALVVIVFTVYSSTTTEKFDMTLTYSGTKQIPEEYRLKIKELISPLCEDLDGNGEKNLYFSSLDIDPESKDFQYIQANSLKLNMAIGEEETYIFIFDKTIADMYKGEASDEIAYAPLEDWVEGDISKFKTYDAHGKAYGIDVSDLAVFKEAGLDKAELYMFIRYYPRKDQLKDQLKGYESAIRLANKILNY